ncbi:NACHT domain- and WD repeat-containing protein 1-like [Mytilus trossulus]|uniref:NACHT domain- and WD repeat-containing protein 1-like n=1 Tax=Mytilus trossulus TaxID=6551 RepID=UPI003004CF73
MSAGSKRPPVPANMTGVLKHKSSFGAVVNGERAAMTVKKPTSVKVTNPAPKTLKSLQNGDKKEEARSDKLSDQIKEAEAKFDKLLEGCLDDLPNLPHSTVRIFMSSTFSDMRSERNAIVRDVNPLLKEYCAKYDLDFQIVDMRWGVTEDSQIDHSVEKICLLEVENCQKISLGPNFILLSGDRYGFTPIPTEIEKTEFEIMKTFAEKESENAALLDIWYRLDENAKPPKYILQPIRSQFTFYGDHSVGCEQLKAKDTLGWEKTFMLLQNILRQAAMQCNAEQLSEEKLHNYFKSVTELEVKKGILTADKPEMHTSVYQRILLGLDIDNSTDITAVKRYFDTNMENGKLIINDQVKLLRGKMVEDKVPLALKKSKRIHQYNLNWYEGGVDPEKHKDHSTYIKQLCDDLIQDVSELIDKAREDQKSLIRKREFYMSYNEVLHHLHFCKLKCEAFCGRVDVLEQAKEYILKDKSRRPLILHAPSGGGKTCVMAKIMENLQIWFKKEPHLGIIRFLGTSRYSLNIYDVLFGLCGQLADIAKIMMEPVGYKNMKNILEYMPRFLRRVSNKVKKPIVILLDSLDQLSSRDDAFILKWLPTVLPSNMKMILSTLPQEHEILNTLQTMFPDNTNFIELPKLPDDTGFEMTKKYLAKRKRAVTQNQANQIINAFRNCRGPLYLKLILDEAVNWNSYTSDNAVLQDSVQGAINQLFDNMEKKFGQVLISHALGYITVAYNGISDIEWEDVLSCDDEVLNDIYRYHNPPVPGIVRMPPVLVARIRYDLREYIVERRSFGKTTLNWYHRQFFETAHGRYAFGGAGKKLHKVLAEYFIANDGIQRDITLHRRNMTVKNADRQVTKQPLVVKNKRKLMAAPYHITHAGDHIDPPIAKSECFCNLKFLTMRMQALPLFTLVDDMTEYLDKTDDEEVAFLRNYFLVSKSENLYGINFAINLLSRLYIAENQQYLEELLHQAKDAVYSSKSPLLIPVFPCLAPRKDPSTALLKTYNDINNIISHGTESVLMTNSRVKNSDGAYYSIYDAINNEIYQLDQNKNFKPIMLPILDKSEKRVIQLGKDSLQTFHLHNQLSNQYMFSKVSKDIGTKKCYPTMSCLSTDSLHLTILFSNGDVLTLDTNSFKKVDLITLGEKPDSVSNIITTNEENLKVILSISAEKKGKNTSSCIRIHAIGSTDNGKIVNTNHTFTKGLAAVGYNESLLVGSSNRENRGTLTVINLEDASIAIDNDLSSEVLQLSVAHSHALAAIWLEQGFVAVYDISNGEVVQQLNVINTITSFGVSWMNDLVFIGDNQGQIIMYKSQTGKQFGNFKADSDEIIKVAVLEDQVVTVSKENTAKVWELTTLLTASVSKLSIVEVSTEGTDLLAQKGIVGFDIDLKGHCIITASEDRNLRIWSVDNVKLLNKIHIGILGQKVLATINSMCIVLDRITKTMKIVDIKKGAENMVTHNVLDFCQGKDCRTLYLVKSAENNQFIEIIDVGLLKIKKSFLLKQNITTDRIDLTLNDSERFLAIRVKVNEKEYEDILAAWQKQSWRNAGFMPESHKHRFYAVDLPQATGGLMPCNRVLTKTPHLGQIIRPYKGNVMMITTRRFVCFWDIPTGKCDYRIIKKEKLGFLYQPKHLEEPPYILNMECSQDGLCVAGGSEEGYMLIWETKTGLPAGGNEPKKRHLASVVHITISPNSRWVVSSCLNNMLILWDIITGIDVASLKIPSDVQQMKFTTDSKHLVINTGFRSTRMLVYRLHIGES